VENDIVARLRREYASSGLAEGAAGDDPYPLLRRWLADAMASGLHEPNAMVLATVAATGAPSARMVLLKGIDADGLTFFTNYESRKADELASGAAALVLVWHPLQRQVRVEGAATRLTRPENEAYFAVRPRGSQLAAWASPQSQEVPDRGYLEQRFDTMAARFGADEPVPCPPYWGGYRVAPTVIEFWQGRVNRLHDRIRYDGDGDGDGWRRTRLAP